MLEMDELASLLVNLIMGIRDINTFNKKMKKVRIRSKIYETKKKAKSIILKDSYDAYDIYKFLLFLRIAKAFDCFNNIPKNISYSCHKSADQSTPGTGVFTVCIDYNKTKTLTTHFKPVVHYLSESKIDMEWIISDNTPHTVDYKIVSSCTNRYNSTVEILKDRDGNPTDNISQTKILEWSSCNILYEAMVICIETVFKEVETRYIYEKRLF